MVCWMISLRLKRGMRENLSQLGIMEMTPPIMSKDNRGLEKGQRGVPDMKEKCLGFSMGNQSLGFFGHLMVVHFPCFVGSFCSLSLPSFLLS